MRDGASSGNKGPVFLPLILAGSAAVLTGPLVAGLWGELHPAFDSLAHFRVHLSALIIVLALPCLFFRGWRIIALTLIVLGLTAIASATMPQTGKMRAGAQAAEDTPQARYRLLHLNLRFDNHTPKQVLSLIGRVEPDLITLAEVSAAWRGELALLENTYPHRLVCSEPTHIGGVAILSRRPFLHPSTARCFDRGALAVATVNINGSTVDVAALHLGWPWPFGQSWQIGRVAPVLQDLGPTTILAGDFNAAPWSESTRRIAAAGDLTVLGGIGPTWLIRPLPNLLRRAAGLPIDNLLFKGGIVPLETTRLADVGSDHLPVLLEFGLRRKKEPDTTLQARVLDR